MPIHWFNFRSPISWVAVPAMLALLVIGGFAGFGRSGSGSGVAAENQITIGVWQPGAPDDIKNLDSFEQSTGIHAGIVLSYEPWGSATDGPNMQRINAVASHGSIPLVTWEPERDPAQPGPFPIYLADVAAGKYDGYIWKWAQAFAAHPGPIMLRWGHEMNGNWYPWGAGNNGNTPEQYVAAWRHLHDIFAAAGAKNVTWVWCPNIALGPQDPIEAYYPGDAYVDWVALDGYNRAREGWRSFTQIFQDSYTRLAALTSKPMMIAEVGSGEAPNDPQGQRKADWITSALTVEIPHSFPRLRALVWFNESKSGVERNGEDWRLNTEAERHAFAAAVARAPYTGRPPHLSSA